MIKIALGWISHLDWCGKLDWRRFGSHVACQHFRENCTQSIL